MYIKQSIHRLGWLRLALSFCLAAAGLAPALGQQAQPEGKTTLTISRTAVEAIFRLKAGDNVNLPLAGAGKEAQPLSGKVISHLNPGPETGAVSAFVAAGKEQYKMLLSRKLKDKSVVYMFSLLPEGSQSAYRLASQSEKEFVLVQDIKENIVTE